MNGPIACPDTPAYELASDAQAIAAYPRHSAWVSANAGSGKTKVLIDRVARLLLKDAAPDSILCVTYTKAAANEMLQRLFSRLGQWSVMNEAELRAELVELEGRADNPHTDDELRAARALFARALETPGGLRIETIHAFCSRILRRFPLEANIAPGFSEIDDHEAETLWQDALQAGLLAADTQDPSLLDAVALAGGGNGALVGLNAARQRTALILRFVDLHDGNPDRIEAALRTALNPPDHSEEELIADAMGPSLPVSDLKKVADILNKDGKTTSVKTSNAILDTLREKTPEARWAYYQTIFFTQSGNLRKSIVNKALLQDDLVVSLFQIAEVPQGSEVLRVKQLDADLKAARLFERTRALILLAAPILLTYRRLKRARAALDFDDLIGLTHALLTQKEAANWVLYKLDGGLDHVLLDEAQDTSPDQWGLLNALTAEFFAGLGKERAQDPRTLFVVGDEKQSIYSFQGADPQQFLRERQSFQLRAQETFGKAHLPEMQMSFRSSPEILDFVDTLSACGEVEGHPYIAGPSSEANLTQHTARRANQPGSVELWPIDVPEPDEEVVAWHAPRDSQSETSPKNKLAKQVASEINAILARGDMVWAEGADRTWSLRKATPGDILILVHKRTGGLFDALIDALKDSDIPVAGADRLVLSEHIGVQDCLNLMRFALLPTDDLTLAEILRGPFGNLVDDDTHLFPLAYQREDCLWSRLCTSQQGAHKTVAAFLANLLSNRHLPPYEFLSGVLERKSEDNKTGWEKLAARLGSPMRDPVQALLDKALAHDASGAASLQTFVADMDLDTSDIKRDLAAPNGEVRVMTVHGAKGLQAPIVILPDTTRRPKTSAPSVLNVNDVPVWLGAQGDDTEAATKARTELKERDARESRRLLYVALTRAQDRLMIFGAWFGTRPKADAEIAPDAGYPKDSWYALCAEAMATLHGDALATGEDGRPVFSRYGAPAETGGTSVDSTQSRPGLPAWLNTPVSPEQAANTVTAPTSLMGEDTPVLPPLGGERAFRLKRGRLIHALLERLPALPLAARREAGERFLARDTGLQTSERKDMLEAAMGVLEDPVFADVFAEGGRAEAAIIGTSPKLPDGIIINGRIDRLIVSDSDVLIVDFKTDRPPPETAGQVGKTYLQQMAAYASVLEQAYPNHKIRAALVWTDGPRLMELPSDLLAGAISQSSVAV